MKSMKKILKKIKLMHFNKTFINKPTESDNTI